MLAELSFSATRFFASEMFLLSPSAASRCANGNIIFVLRQVLG